MIDRVLEFIKDEPVAFGGAITALVQAVIGVLVAFNIDITPDQQTAILTLTASLVAFTALGATIARNQVTPVANPKSNKGEKLIPEV